MTLGEIIELLEQAPQDKICDIGFYGPHSYRGYYECLAFEPCRDISVSKMLEHAKDAVGKKYTGHKGGEFRMGEYTDCYLAEYGSSGDEINSFVMAVILDNKDLIKIVV